ncbi:alpha/beta fold hydrolase [Bacillus cereus]|uniref:alpha/beta hydrolase family protein n=1 Tax=Bacillus cereus TaxID=1396 RepID=UPI002ADED9E2|nr:alpha/beta fold hydrolase [Bacillus cereus]MEA1012701.1 alpha/beta fold hydrolase [Bacillus cereus]
MITTKQPVSIPNGSHHVPGIFVSPSGATKDKPVPAVLLLHGTASNKNEIGDIFKRLAAQLASRGYASLRIDFAGGGDSSQPFVENNFDDSVSDAMKSVEFLANFPGVDPNRIGVLGYSQGGSIGQVTAARNPKVKALATWSSKTSNGAKNLEFIFKYAEEAKAKGSAMVTLPWGQKLHFGGKFFTAMENSRPLDEIAKFKGPLLAIGGSEDSIISPLLARKLVQHAGSNDATLRIIEGADHGFKILGADDKINPDQSIAEKLLKITTDWFAEKL